MRMQSPTPRRTVAKPLAPPPRFVWTPARVALAVVAAAALVWLLWPSPYGRVRNLASRGSSVVAFGDSLTAGYGAAPGEDYPSQLSKRLGVAVVNAGLSGDTTDSALARIDADLLQRDPRIVLVGLGGNDFLRGAPIATTEQNLRAIVRRIQTAGAMVVLLGFDFPSLTADYDAMYARLADEEHCLLVRHMLRGILTESRLKSDEIHPNAAGYALMAERLAAPCAHLMQKADRERR